MATNCTICVVTIGIYCCVADVDYESGAFDVTFDVGDTSAEISINITEDFIDEESEAFRLVLKRTGDTPALVQIVEPVNATGIIDDNDETGVCVRACVRAWVHACVCV